MDGKQAILTKAVEVFMRYGLRSVTMDDLSRELGISKKTLYQHFSNKDELIEEALEMQSCEEHENYERIREVAQDAVEEFLLISQFGQDAFREIPPVVIFDLRKYHPEIFRKSLRKDFQRIYDTLRSNLEWGIREGLYREELPVDAATRLFIAQMEGFVQEHIFPPENEQLIRQALEVKDNLFLRGVCTAKGLERLKHYRSAGLRKLPLPFLGRSMKQNGS